VSTYSGDNSTFGIDVSETLTITGNGNLTAASGDTTYGVSYGIRTYGDVNITSGTLTATGGAANVFSYGIFIGGNSINITGGAVTASGNTRALNIAPVTLPAFYNWKTSAGDALTSSATTALPSVGTYVYIESVTGVTPTTYTFNKAVSNDVFRIDYSLAPGITFNDNVKNGTTALASATEWWSVDDNTIEITSSYLMGLPVGTYTITLDTTADVDPTVTLTVTNVYEWGLYLNASGELVYDINTITQGTPSTILGGGSYTFADGILTLNNVNFTTSAMIAFYLEEYLAPVTLNINGSNSFASTYNSSFTSQCIFIEQPLTITGDGSLTAVSGNSSNGSSYGISTNGDITISGTVNVTVTSGTAGNNSHGIKSGTGDVNFTGGEMMLSGYTSAANSGLITPAIAAVDYNNADGRAAVRIDNTEIDLSTIKYIKTYETLSDYLKDYPRATTPEPAPVNSPYNNPAPPSPLIALTDFDSGENVGSIRTSKTVKTLVRFNSKRLAQTEEYVVEKWSVDALGSFETRQKGGWGATATITISLEKLGFELEDGTKLYVLIFDTKNKKWYEAEAEIIDGNIVIVTEWSGVFAIVAEEV
jgi:hypothetical protein